MERAEAIDVGWVSPGASNSNFVHSIAHTLRDMEYFGCAGRVYHHSSALPVLSRNHLIREFLEESDSPWLWLVDDDMVFDKGHPMKLWETANEYDVKMVSGLAFIFHYNGGEPTPSYYIEGDGEFFSSADLIQPKNRIPVGPMEVMATGLASSLIHREVFEAMPAERFEEYRWFDIGRTNPKGQPLGEDLQFFVRAAELGYQLLLEPSARTWHVKEIAVGVDEFNRAWSLDEAQAA